MIPSDLSPFARSDVTLKLKPTPLHTLHIGVILGSLALKEPRAILSFSLHFLNGNSFVEHTPVFAFQIIGGLLVVVVNSGLPQTVYSGLPSFVYSLLNLHAVALACVNSQRAGVPLLIIRLNNIKLYFVLPFTVERVDHSDSVVLDFSDGYEAGFAVD